MSTSVQHSFFYIYSTTNAIEETDIITFNKKLSSLVQHIAKHKGIIIGGDIIVRISKDENKFYLPDLSNRNGEYLADFSPENGLAYLNTKFRKREGKLWI